MSKIDELIQQYCPNGVESLHFGDFIDYEQPTRYIVHNERYDDSSKTPVLTAGQTFVLGYTDEEDGIYPASSSNPVIIFDDFTGAFKWVDFPFKVKSSAMKMLSTSKGLTTLRYTYHMMGYLNFTSTEHKRLWISTYSQFLIPFPPLPVQEEIVRILDKFTELEARRRQYEYYRNKLLDFNELQRYSWGVKLMTLGSFCEIGTGRSNRDDAIANGSYPFYVRSKDVFRNNEYEFDDKEAVIIPGEGGIGEIFHYAKGKYALHQRAYRISPKMEGISGKYLYYFLMVHFRNFIQKRAVSATVTSIRKPMLEDFEIAILPLPEQERIVTILDRFDALVNDLSSGLPAELEARRRQYEYYRDRLLSFPPAV